MLARYLFATLFSFLLVSAAAAAAAAAPRAEPKRPLQGPYVVDSGGRPVEGLEIGSSLETGARGLRPSRLFEFDLMLGEQRISYARAMSSRRGDIEPFILWFQSGVVGCSIDWEREAKFRPLAFHNFEEAEHALKGRTLELFIREVPQSARGMERGTTLERPRPRARLLIPAQAHRSPMVFPATSKGCLLNSAETGSGDMFVAGHNFSPGEKVELSVAAAPVTVQADAQGRFVAKAWDRKLQRRGAYDIVARRVTLAPPLQLPRVIRAIDVVSFGHDTAFILFLYYPPGGTLMDVAGRPLPKYPYFQFADSFADTNDNVWGAVDPTYIPAGHTGGNYAAYYVVNHRSASQWAMSTNLVDVSGGIEVMPVKAGCVNGTDTVIWYAPLAVGSYDVVVNFGSVPASSAGAFTDDFTYDSAVDFLDGAVQIGFRVAPDPYNLGSIPIGQASYSFDDALYLSDPVSTYEAGAPGSANVDLRAVVRYPATVAGSNTPVTPGSHPIFVMEHGNHSFCNVFATSHASCPTASRKLNHQGYMHLLDALASHGIIAVSIDAYDLTGGVPQWIPERGDLILKHLEFWSHLNNSTTYSSYSDPFSGLFAGHVDFSMISVSGHSRGGEASVAAYARNFLRPVAQQFAVGSVSSIAPVDGQSYVLGDVPYFVILPASDCDVSSLSGARIYDRAGTATDQTVKSGIDIYGADHNFFNTIWAADGDDCGSSSRNDYIPAADQQKLGEAYLAAFVRSQLLGEDVYEDMLRGRLVFPSTAGRKIYAFRHEKNHLKLDAGSAAGTVAGGATAIAVANPSVHQTQADKLNWSGANQSYSYTLPSTDVSGFEVVTFRAAQTNAAVNPGTGQEFQVRLTGGANNHLTYTGMFDPIPKPYDRGWANNQNVMTSVRIPLHSFIMNNAPADLTQVSKVELIFVTPNQGEIYVDDVEFSR